MRARLRSRLAEQERIATRCQREAASLRNEVRSLREVLDALDLGVVVRDAAGVEIIRNRRAGAPTDDLQADALVARAVAELFSSSEGARTLELHGPPRRSVSLAAHALVSGGTVVVIEDASERTRLDAMRRDFVDNVNHELRTPIGALGVLAEALEGETDPAVISRLVGRMGTEVTRAHALIEDLLDLSRIEQPGGSAHAPVDVADVVNAAVARVQPLSERFGVRVSVAPVTSAVVVQGDWDELVSAVANLVDNAVKYSDEGGEVDVAVVAGPQVVDIVVRDTGIGIPAKDVDRIFERFYRVDRARDRRTGGSGLGLAIVRHVAVNHGGEVLVSSGEGEGSTFTLRIKGAS